MRAVQFDRLGGPEVLSLREVPTPEPTPGTVLVRNRVIAVNFGDLWFIRGQYLVKPRFPDTPGMEAAGIVEAVAPDVEDLREGMAVAYIGMGAFADFTRIRSSRVIPLPEGADLEQAASFPADSCD
jgi:NADPH:quinone reductase